MYLIRVILISFLVISNETTSLKSNDFCFINSTYMKEIGCSKDYTFRCSENFCTKNRTACGDKTIRLLMTYPERFKHVKKCDPPTSVCLNVYIQSKKKYSLNGNIVVSQTYYPCSRKNSVACKLKYCSDSKASCDHFIQSKGNEFDLNKCGLFVF
jgi:hypothetical protein